jgi:hypothetical protein
MLLYLKTAQLTTVIVLPHQYYMMYAVGAALVNTEGENFQLQEHILVISEVFKVDEDLHCVLTSWYMCSMAGGCQHFREHFFTT